MYLIAGLIGVNVALHRYFSHRGFSVHNWTHYLLLLISILPCLGSPVAWGTMHLYHHIHSDTENDPHSPTRRGYFKSWFAVWPKTEPSIDVFREFLKSPGVLFVHKYYFSIVFSYAAILAIVDWRLAIFAFAIPAVGCFHGAAAIAVIPHIKMPGNYRRHSTFDQSYNSLLANLLSLGEGWHNNHHNNAKKYKHGEAWWEIDVAAWLIRAIKK